MKLELQGLCRGDGKIFIKVSIRGTLDENSTHFRAENASSSFSPCDAYPLPELQQGCFVIALPILSSTQKLIVEERDTTDGLVSVATKSISPFRAKWESRLNYRLKKSLCQEIRAFDEEFLYGRCSMHFWACRPAGQRNELCATVIAPQNCDLGNLTIGCFDDCGKAVQIEPLFLESRICRPVSYSSHEITQAQVLLSLPEIGQDYFFTLQDSQFPKNNAFSVLEKEWYATLLRHSLAGRGNARLDLGYDAWFKKQRAKHVCLE
ncbi:MAG: hypothetical protein FWE65_03215, partial [Eggerthellaceae bacterium]|nr:hypothetical protein [Eggerthellaceae bacterium]